MPEAEHLQRALGAVRGCQTVPKELQQEELHGGHDSDQAAAGDFRLQTICRAGSAHLQGAACPPPLRACRPAAPCWSSGPCWRVPGRLQWPRRGGSCRLCARRPAGPRAAAAQPAAGTVRYRLRREVLGEQLSSAASAALGPGGGLLSCCCHLIEQDLQLGQQQRSARGTERRLGTLAATTGNPWVKCSSCAPL